ncbi:hypothetical protein HPB50_004105 [Hyalomma asiaticum]|uniref:Uncharacterized protein n=1 Tax=Hyalomma asiaticum TaxID=266040 RepID=A0ACB7TAP1_HYAAI|nr:hypothetical protein HPB50_004105 [Hyalomma asiaticum]
MCEIERGLSESEAYTRERMVEALSLPSISFLGHRSLPFFFWHFYAHTKRSGRGRGSYHAGCRVCSVRSRRGTSIDVQFGAL